MTLLCLNVANLRNLTSIAIQANPQFNVIFGANGSGKTSLLESIYLLGYGRSFRTHLTDRLIQNDQEKLTVFAQYQGAVEKLPVGIERTKQGQCLIRVANKTVSSSAELAKLFPIQLINPNSYQLLEEGPKYRREFLDWALFHVEHSFYDIWKTHQKALKQRNAALKTTQNKAQIGVWNAVLQESANKIDGMRKTLLETLIPLCLEYCQSFAAIRDIEFCYFRGWDDCLSYSDVLDMNFFKDKQVGYTQSGPNRADLVIKIRQAPAQDVLSRGEKKILVNSLMLARGALLQQLNNKQSIYLIDDLPAELDLAHRGQMAEKLIQLKAQIFVTGIERGDLDGLFPKEYSSMFHVEHGRVL